MANTTLGGDRISFGFGKGLPRFDRSMWVLIASFLVEHAGYYLALPFLVVLFTGTMGLTAGQAGLVLGAISVAYQVSGVIGGPLSDRIGRRVAMVVGLSLQTLGFLLYAWVTTLPLLLAAGGLIGVGGGLFAPSARAGIAALASAEDRTTAFSLRGVAANVGMSLGPLLGALLVDRPSLLFGAAAAFHAVLALALPFLLPSGCEAGACAQGAGGAILRAFRRAPFALFSLTAVFVWALDAQMVTAVPLRVTELLGNPKGIGLLATFNSALIIFLQVPLSTWVLKRMNPMGAMAAGVVLIGAGLASVAWATSFWFLVGSVTLIALGQMFYVPTIDNTVSTFARGESIGSFFGIATLVWGMGTAIGNLLGGQSMAIARTLGRPGLPWTLFALLAGVTVAALLVLRRWAPMQAALGGDDGPD